MKRAIHRFVAFSIAAVLLAPAPLYASEAALERYGSPADGMPFDRELRLWPHARIGVWRSETVRFLTESGREFRWRFDGPAFQVFPLERIAPAEVTLPQGIRVYVSSEIPIAP